MPDLLSVETARVIAIHDSKKDYPAVQSILREIKMGFTELYVQEASTTDDKNNGIDFHVYVPPIHCASRIRGAKSWFDTVTFRTWRYTTESPDPRYSEIPKILAGKAQWNWMFYARRSYDDPSAFSDWIIIDKQALIRSGLLEEAGEPIWNKTDPRNGFQTILIEDLFDRGCIIHSSNQRGVKD